MGTEECTPGVQPEDSADLVSFVETTAISQGELPVVPFTLMSRIVSLLCASDEEAFRRLGDDEDGLHIWACTLAVTARNLRSCSSTMAAFLTAFNS